MFIGGWCVRHHLKQGQCQINSYNQCIVLQIAVVNFIELGTVCVPFHKNIFIQIFLRHRILQDCVFSKQIEVALYITPRYMVSSKNSMQASSGRVDKSLFKWWPRGVRVGGTIGEQSLLWEYIGESSLFIATVPWLITTWKNPRVAQIHLCLNHGPGMSDGALIKNQSFTP